MNRTAGIVIIGNEILSGKFRDDNAFFLAAELRNLGVEVKKISFIPDDPAEIGSETAAFSGRFDYVFTTGGIGPTHDDVTMEGIARGFGVALVRNASLEHHFLSRYGDKINPAVLKMADVPEGAEVIDFGNNRFPLVAFRNVFVFPGIPEYLRTKFAALRERFRSEPIILRKVYIKGLESDIAAELNAIVAAFPDVVFGSYPVVDNPEYGILVTIESRNPDALGNAVHAFLGKLPADRLVRTE